MLNEALVQAVQTAAANITRDEADPLMVQCIIPAGMAENGYISLFRSMAYFLKFKVKEAKENPLHQYGIYLKSLDSFVFGAYITVLDNDGETSVTLDYTYNADEMQDMISQGFAICTDEPCFAAYSAAATRGLTKDGKLAGFHILAEYQHTVYRTVAEVLRHYLETLLDSGEEAVVEYPGLFKATCGLDETGNKFIKVTPDATVTQLVKDDDLNEVNEIIHSN